jgi:7-carboxy-7-deazaguanine synthase
MTFINEQKFPVMEHFYTIQGEGFHTGRAAYFIRFGGCNVGCVWCDVKESWDADIHPKYTVDELLGFVAKSQAQICVITGGEPAMYDLSILIDELHTMGIRVHIETSGAYEIKGHYDWVCISPKKFKFPVKEALLKANEFKAIVFNRDDIKWAQSYVKDLPIDCLLYLQPEWSKQEKNLPLILDFIKHNQNWRISLQTHKFMDIP